MRGRPAAALRGHGDEDEEPHDAQDHDHECGEADGAEGRREALGEGGEGRKPPGLAAVPPMADNGRGRVRGQGLDGVGAPGEGEEEGEEDGPVDVSVVGLVLWSLFGRGVCFVE